MPAQGGWDARSLSHASRAQFRRVAAGGRQLARRSPLAVKALPTAIGFAFGDVLTQYMHSRAQRTPSFVYDWTRGAKMAAVGAVLGGPLGLGLLRWMDAHIMTHNPHGLAAMTVKLTLDQVVGCVLWQAAYMCIHPPYRLAAQQLLAQLQEQTADVTRRLQLPASLQPAAQC